LTVLAAHPGAVGELLALLGGLVLLAIVVRARGWTPQGRASVAQDAVYIARRAVLDVPLTALALAGLDHAVTAFAPWLRLGLFDRLPAVAGFLAWFLLVDLLGYGIHRLFHLPRLWPFHAIHHAQPWLNPLTTTRTHPVEIVAKRLLTWAPLAVFGHPDQPWLLWVALDGFWGFFVHSGLRVSLGPLKYVIVEPGFHAVHHSRAPEHHGANYGQRLAIWDLVFGTARYDVGEVTSVGIDDAEFPVETATDARSLVRTTVAQLVYPLRTRL
jgi:sterol desaturase/sphingolipid hydroxylase (fatty acid hydroxylase superfamily)